MYQNNIVSVGLSVDWRRKFKIEFSVEKSFIDEFLELLKFPFMEG